MKFYQGYFAVGLATPVVATVLGYVNPPDNDPLILFLLVFSVLAITLTPISIFVYFSYAKRLNKRSQGGLVILELLSTLGGSSVLEMANRQMRLSFSVIWHFSCRHSSVFWVGGLFGACKFEAWMHLPPQIKRGVRLPYELSRTC